MILKKMEIKKMFIIICFLVIYSGNAQTLSYKLTSKGGNPIGNLTATKTISGNIMQIDVVSEVKAKIFIEIDVKYKLHSTYKNSELFFSSVTTYVNEKVHSSSKTEKSGDYYTITKNGHASKFLNKIDFSDALLYFEVPKNKSQLFSESNMIEKQIKQTGVNTYDVINPNNSDVSEYKYANGILQKATIHDPFMTFILTKQ